jgi:hypothetical protein
MESSECRGVCVIASGRMVAWFAEFNEAAHEWCTDNYFGQWILWKAKSPEIIPLTTEELKECERQAALFKLVFESDNEEQHREDYEHC